MSVTEANRTRSFQYVLIPLVVELSESDNWEQAQNEWDYTQYSHVPSTLDVACLCGYRPISHLHTISNRVNGNEAVIGSCCIRQFMGLADSELKGIARIRADTGKALSASAIALAHSQGWINDWEHGFCMSTRLKRNLSRKQEEKRKQINERLLARLAPVMLTERRVEATAQAGK